MTADDITAEERTQQEFADRADFVSQASGRKQHVIVHEDGVYGVHSGLFLDQRGLRGLVIYTSPFGEEVTS